MAKHSGQKLRLLYLHKIMSEQTDSTHGLTLTEISQELSRYGIYAERKTLYDDIEALRLFGYDIKVRRKMGVRYFLGERTLSPMQIKLLGDSVKSSPVLSLRDRQTLMRKLISLGGKETLSLFKRDQESGDDFGAGEQLNKLCSAIAGNKRISCRCFFWNSRKQRIMRFDGERLILSPWFLELDKAPVLVAYDHKEKRFLTMRADRLIDLEILNADREGGEEYAELLSNGGLSKLLCETDATVIRLRATNVFADEVISRFGVGITVTNNSDKHFEFSVKAKPDSELFSWVFSHASDVELLSPDSVLIDYKNMVRRAADKI